MQTKLKRTLIYLAYAGSCLFNRHCALGLRYHSNAKCRMYLQRKLLKLWLLIAYYNINWPLLDKFVLKKNMECRIRMQEDKYFSFNRESPFCHIL